MQPCLGILKKTCIVSLLLVVSLTLILNSLSVTNPVNTRARAFQKLSVSDVQEMNDPELNQPHQHVYYLKTHKTGSTTLFTILGEYCRTHDLLPLLPTNIHFNQGLPLREEQIFLAGNVSTYDMIINHHIFTPKMLSYLHNDTFTVTILREPFNNFVSAFNYYRKRYGVSYLTRVPGNNPVMKFLLNYNYYEIEGYGSYTNNRQSMDLGYDLSHSFHNINYINKFIAETEKRFHLVMITEYFDEGLIILKRRLNWRTEDIIYTIKNESPPDMAEQKDWDVLKKLKQRLHAKHAMADVRLYQHFLALFKQRKALEMGLDEEVREFRQILGKVRDYCEYVTTNTGNLIFEQTKWSDAFQISPDKCQWLEIPEVSMTSHLKSRQRAKMSSLV